MTALVTIALLHVAPVLVALVHVALVLLALVLIKMVLTAAVLTRPNSTGASTLFFVCIAQKLAPAGEKNSTDISARSAAFCISALS